MFKKGESTTTELAKKVNVGNLMITDIKESGQKILKFSESNEQ